LSDVAVIRLISTHCVPVALNLYTLRDSRGEDGKFFRTIEAQPPKQVMGLWLATWDGRVLAGAVGEGLEGARWTSLVLTRLQEGLEKFGAIAPRGVRPTKLLPYRGTGVRPDGSVILAVTDKRIFEEDGPPGLAQGSVLPKSLGSVPISAAQWSALAPADARAGSQWTVPEDVGRQFWPLLTPFDAKFRKPEEVTEVELVGRVASVRDGIAHLFYRGRLAGLHSGNGWGWDGFEMVTTMKMVSGVGAYDVRTGQMLSLTWVWDGLYTDYYRPPFRGQPARFGAVVEWRRGDPKAAAPLEANAPGPGMNVELADSTPEEALKTFLLALAAHDEATLRAVALPDAELDRLVQGPPASPEALARLRAQLEGQPMRRLREGDAVRMPDGESRVIKPADVRAGRVVLWPSGAPLPSRVEEVGGHWKVFARPFIAARKRAEADRQPIRPASRDEPAPAPGGEGPRGRPGVDGRYQK
jgi:hypothetical protein